MTVAIKDTLSPRPSTDHAVVYRVDGTPTDFSTEKMVVKTTYVNFMPFQSEGETADEAWTNLLRKISDAIGTVPSGHWFWRNLPMVEKQVDFETMKTIWRGYARFGIAPHKENPA